jgi:hypothetical protein
MGSLPPLQDRLAGVAFTPRNFAAAAFTAGQTQTAYTPPSGKQVFLGSLIQVSASAATHVTVKIGAQIVAEVDINASELFADVPIPLGMLFYNPTMANNEAVTITSSAIANVGMSYFTAESA